MAGTMPETMRTTTARSRSGVASHPKCSAHPPQKPPIFLFLLDRMSLFGGGGGGANVVAWPQRWQYLSSSPRSSIPHRVQNIVRISNPYYVRRILFVPG